MFFLNCATIRRTHLVAAIAVMFVIYISSGTKEIPSALEHDRLPRCQKGRAYGNVRGGKRPVLLSANRADNRAVAVVGPTNSSPQRGSLLVRLNLFVTGNGPKQLVSCGQD